MPIAREIKQLIIKSFLGELSDHDSELLEQWKNEEIRHQHQYQLLSTKWKSGELRKNWEEIDVQQNWLEIEQKVNQQKNYAFVPWLRFVAAASLLIFMAVVLYEITADQTLINRERRFLVHELEDGSRVWLKPGARIDYHPYSFSDDRTIKLEGEAFFEVKKGNVPFIVKSLNGGEVEVLGTAFHVMALDAQTEVLLIEGSVRFSSPQQALYLLPGELALFDGQILKKESTDNLNVIGWKTGQFEFEETPLYQVLEYIAPYYGIETEVSDEKRNLLLTTSIQQLSLDELVIELAFILDAEVTLNQQKLFIR